MFIILLVLFPILYLLYGKYALMVLFAAIAWKYVERLQAASTRKPPKRGRDDEPQYQAGYEN